MPSKCFKICSCFCFIIFSVSLFLWCWLSPDLNLVRDYDNSRENVTGVLTLSNAEVHWQLKCYLHDFSSILKKPSLESFIRASSTEEARELRGLAVYSNLTNACQLPVDVSKTNVNKIALITVANKTVCPLPELAVNAQKAGYSAVIYFAGINNDTDTDTDTQDKLEIPVLRANVGDCFSLNKGNDRDDSFWSADRSDVEISVSQTALMKMQWYLERLYYWFFLGPLITLEWLRRTKKFCYMSGGQQGNEERGTEDEEAVGETSFYSVSSVVNETQENNNQETEHEQTAGEEQPLIIVTSNPHSNLTNTEHTRPTTIRRVTTLFAKILFGKFAIGCGYVILIIASLPVGISSGGWSFFRFDENEDVNVKSFWDDVFNSYKPKVTYVTNNSTTVALIDFDTRSKRLKQFLLLWWSPLQIFCFFLYSTFACKTTWTVPTNFSKLIRSDWLASNVYLVILGVAVPYCSFDLDFLWDFKTFILFTFYNTVCQICNLFFIIILNKHKFVTRYVFYISVCMICAYVESDIVALFYYMLNSKGSLNNLKLTALRTVAIVLTLTLSFSSSMHIIRKLTKSQESLFEGLGEN